MNRMNGDILGTKNIFATTWFRASATKVAVGHQIAMILLEISLLLMLMKTAKHTCRIAGQLWLSRGARVNGNESGPTSQFAPIARKKIWCHCGSTAFCVAIVMAAFLMHLILQRHHHNLWRWPWRRDYLPSFQRIQWTSSWAHRGRSCGDVGRWSTWTGGVKLVYFLPHLYQIDLPWYCLSRDLHHSEQSWQGLRISLIGWIFPLTLRDQEVTYQQETWEHQLYE